MYCDYSLVSLELQISVRQLMRCLVRQNKITA